MQLPRLVPSGMVCTTHSRPAGQGDLESEQSAAAFGEFGAGDARRQLANRTMRKKFGIVVQQRVLRIYVGTGFG